MPCDKRKKAWKGIRKKTGGNEKKRVYFWEALRRKRIMEKKQRDNM